MVSRLKHRVIEEGADLDISKVFMAAKSNGLTPVIFIDALILSLTYIWRLLPLILIPINAA